jgi:hypothetical protein
MSVRAWRRIALMVAVGGVSAMVLAPSANAEICNTEAEAGKLPPGTIVCFGVENWEVSGSLTDRKLNQSLELKEGTFNGFSAFTNIEPVTGVIHGVAAVKPFEATIKLFGTSTKVGLTFEEVGEANGSINEIAHGTGNCVVAPEELCVHESIPTQANLGFTSITLFGLKIPVSCKTVTPVSLPLEEDLMLFGELFNPQVGSHFMGTTTFPPVKCGGAFGIVDSVVLSALFSGPNNRYSIKIRPSF